MSNLKSHQQEQLCLFQILLPLERKLSAHHIFHIFWSPAQSFPISWIQIVWLLLFHSSSWLLDKFQRKNKFVLKITLNSNDLIYWVLCDIRCFAKSCPFLFSVYVMAAEQRLTIMHAFIYFTLLKITYLAKRCSAVKSQMNDSSNKFNFCHIIIPFQVEWNMWVALEKKEREKNFKMFKYNRKINILL